MAVYRNKQIFTTSFKARFFCFATYDDSYHSLSWLTLQMKNLFGNLKLDKQMKSLFGNLKMKIDVKGNAQ